VINEHLCLENITAVEKNFSLGKFFCKHPILFYMGVPQHRVKESQGGGWHACYLTTTFHVAMCLFNNRSENDIMWSEKKVADKANPNVSLNFLPQFDVFFDLLLKRHWMLNMLP